MKTVRKHRFATRMEYCVAAITVIAIVTFNRVIPMLNGWDIAICFIALSFPFIASARAFSDVIYIIARLITAMSNKLNSFYEREVTIAWQDITERN